MFLVLKQIILGCDYSSEYPQNMDKLARFLYLSNIAGLIQARLCKIQGLFKDFSDFPTVFKDWKLMKNTDLQVKMLESITKDISLR